MSGSCVIVRRELLQDLLAVACLRGAFAEMRCRLRGRPEVSRYLRSWSNETCLSSATSPLSSCNIFCLSFSYSSSIITNAGSTTHRIIMSHHPSSSSPPPFPATDDDVAAVASPNELELDADGVDELELGADSVGELQLGADGVDELYACELHSQVSRRPYRLRHHLA